MRYKALACDYDGTLAHDGQVAPATRAALRKLKKAGRKLFLVSGRELEDLRRVFDALDLFDWLVLENGPLLYHPASGTERTLGSRPPAAAIERLRQRGVEPLSVGRVVLATWQPHEGTVRDVLHEMQLDWQVILNKGAVMILPAGIDKKAGLTAVLREMNLTPDEVVGVGDAENDGVFLEACGLSVAVANALPEVKERVDHVTRGGHGAGVVELIERLLGEEPWPA